MNISTEIIENTKSSIQKITATNKSIIPSAGLINSCIANKSIISPIKQICIINAKIGANIKCKRIEIGI